MDISKERRELIKKLKEAEKEHKLRDKSYEALLYAALRYIIEHM